MTHLFSKFIEGNRFEVVSDSWSLNEPLIMVPVSVAAALDEATLGQCIKQLIDDAWLAKAMSMAEMLCQYKRLTPALMEELKDEIALIERFEGRDTGIDEAMALINAGKVKAGHRLAAPQKRREITARYGNLFMTIGRRDGFACARCNTSANDLQIDHKVAVINGGSNDLENLQLLCARCNSQKSDKE